MLEGSFVFCFFSFPKRKCVEKSLKYEADSCLKICLEGHCFPLLHYLAFHFKGIHIIEQNCCGFLLDMKHQNMLVSESSLQ